MSKRNRAVTERWFIEGTLELTTPTSLSNGDDDPLVDLPVVVDALDGRALLVGASLAGALRACLAGFGQGNGPDYAQALFGGNRGNPDGAQSPLIVDDALGDKPEIELRDGVSIDPATRTAKAKERYDRQLLAAGTTFDLSFELVLTERDNKGEMKAALLAALQGLQQGDIRLGGRKRRGYGQCRVTSWRAWRYDLGTPEGVRGWLAHGRAAMPGRQPAQWTWKAAAGGPGISQWDALKDAGQLTRKATPFTLSAAFDIDGAVLIRSGFEIEAGPDAVHLRMRRRGEEKTVPILSGTSLAGVIRGQALRIARTVAGANGDEAELFIRSLFGGMERPTRGMTREQRAKMKKGTRASRVTVDESEIAGPSRDIVQTRVKIDRFTGGAYESALFAEQPIFGGRFTLGLSLRAPTDAEVGLLLLVLKDLWTGFLPVGGGSSVGRGRLKGKEATIRYGDDTWRLASAGDSAEAITVSPEKGAATATLNGYVTAFTNAMQGGS